VRGGRGERGYNRRGIQDRSTLYFPFYYWGRIIKCNCEKGLRNFPLCHSQSPLLMDFTPPPLLNKSGLILVCNVKLYMKTSSLRTLKIMPRNLIEIVRLWTRLLVCSVHCQTCTVTIPPQHSSTLPPPSSSETHQEPDNDKWGPLWVLVVKYSAAITLLLLHIIRNFLLLAKSFSDAKVPCLLTSKFDRGKKIIFSYF
jgi:hypothetical protein